MILCSEQVSGSLGSGEGGVLEAVLSGGPGVLDSTPQHMEASSLCPVCPSPSQDSYISCLRNLFPSLVNLTPGKIVKLIHLRCAGAMRPGTEATKLHSITVARVD